MLLAAAQPGVTPAAAPAPAPAPAPQVYVPQTWDEVWSSQKAFIAAATPVMAVALGIITAVVSAAKCPGQKYDVHRRRR